MREQLISVECYSGYKADERPLLAAYLHNANGSVSEALALNDVVVQKHATGRMLDFETHLDGTYVNTHAGDGIVIASATGSTAYALSCGGPILYPELAAVVLEASARAEKARKPVWPSLVTVPMSVPSRALLARLARTDASVSAPPAMKP